MISVSAKCFISFDQGDKEYLTLQPQINTTFYERLNKDLMSHIAVSSHLISMKQSNKLDISHMILKI